MAVIKWKMRNNRIAMIVPHKVPIKEHCKSVTKDKTVYAKYSAQSLIECAMTGIQSFSNINIYEHYNYILDQPSF